MTIAIKNVSPLPSYNLVSNNKTILDILARIKKVASSDCSILLIGETGVGKELFAEYIHRTSDRSDQSLIKVGLSTLPSNLLESELFGHEKGSFTGSVQEKRGQFELADKGTVFLDDIDDFPFELQSKLLRVLESKEIKRVGGQHSIPLDIRLITASKLDLGDMVAQSRFRMDLFYRINVFPIIIPPLRDRIDDIPLLIDHFLNHYEPNKEFTVTDDALEALKNYSWPGNVRELRNIIQRIALFANNKIKLENLPIEIRGNQPLNLFIKSCSGCFSNGKMKFDEVMACVESNLIKRALKKSDGNQSLAARTLGLNLSTFRDKMKKYNLDKIEL